LQQQKGEKEKPYQAENKLYEDADGKLTDEEDPMVFALDNTDIY
jgi:hypothetical protein